MDCNDVCKNLQEFLDQELPDIEMQDMKSHIYTCGECGRKFELDKLLKEAIKDKIIKWNATDTLRENVRYHVLNSAL